MRIEQTSIQKIIAIARIYGATRLILFGSTLDMPKEARDIDLACDGVPGWKLYEMAARLEDELGMSLDAVSLSPSTHFTKLIERKGKRLLCNIHV